MENYSAEDWEHAPERSLNEKARQKLVVLEMPLKGSSLPVSIRASRRGSFNDCPHDFVGGAKIFHELSGTDVKFELPLGPRGINENAMRYRNTNQYNQNELIGPDVTLFPKCH